MCFETLHLLICTVLKVHKIIAEALYKIHYYHDDAFCFVLILFVLLRWNMLELPQMNSPVVWDDGYAPHNAPPPPPTTQPTPPQLPHVALQTCLQHCQERNVRTTT